MIIIRVFLIILGLYCIDVSSPFWGVVFIIIAFAIPSKKGKQKKRQQTQQSRSYVDSRNAEDRKRQILLEIQMCQQRIIAIEGRMDLRNATDDYLGIFGAALQLTDIKNLEAEKEYLIDLQNEYDSLSRL